MAQPPSWRIPFARQALEWSSSLVLLRERPLSREQVIQETKILPAATAAQMVDNARAFGLIAQDAPLPALQRQVERFLAEKISDGSIDNVEDTEQVFALQWQFEEKLLQVFLSEDLSDWQHASTDSWHALLRTVQFARADMSEAIEFLRCVPWKLFLEPSIQRAVQKHFNQFRQRSVSTALQVARREESTCLQAQFALGVHGLSCDANISHPVYAAIEQFDFSPLSQTENLFAQLLEIPELTVSLAGVVQDFQWQQHANPLSLAHAALRSWGERGPKENAVLEPLFQRALAFVPHTELDALAWSAILSARVAQGSLPALQILHSMMSNSRDSRLLALSRLAPEAAEKVIESAVEVLRKTQLENEVSTNELKMFQFDQVKLLRGVSELAQFLVQRGFLGKEDSKLYVQLEYTYQEKQQAQGLEADQPNFVNLQTWIRSARPGEEQVFFTVLREFAVLHQRTGAVSLPWTEGVARERLENLAQDARWYSLSALQLLANEANSSPNEFDLRFFQERMRSQALSDTVADYQRVYGGLPGRDDFVPFRALLEHTAVPQLLTAAEHLALSKHHMLANDFVPIFAELVRKGVSGKQALEILFHLFTTPNDLFFHVKSQLAQLSKEAYRGESPLWKNLRVELSARLQSLVLSAAPDVALAAFDVLTAPAEICEGERCPLFQRLKNFPPQRFMDFYKRGVRKGASLEALGTLMLFCNERAFRMVLQQWIREPSGEMMSLLSPILSAGAKDPRSKWASQVVHAFVQASRRDPNHPQAVILFNILRGEAAQGNADAIALFEDPTWQEEHVDLARVLQLDEVLQAFSGYDSEDEDYDARLDDTLELVDVHLKDAEKNKDALDALLSGFMETLLDDQTSLELRLYVLQKMVELAEQGNSKAVGQLIMLEHAWSIGRNENESSQELWEFLQGSANR